MPLLAPAQDQEVEEKTRENTFIIKVEFREEELKFLKDFSEKHNVEPGSIIESGIDICESILNFKEMFKKEGQDSEAPLPILAIGKSDGQFDRFNSSVTLGGDFPLNCLGIEELYGSDRARNKKINITFSEKQMDSLSTKVGSKIEGVISHSSLIRACLTLFALAIKAKNDGGVLGIAIGDDIKHKVKLSFNS
jgi:hypothetical protein